MSITDIFVCRYFYNKYNDLILFENKVISKYAEDYNKKEANLKNKN
jgi:hypothetical protein